MNCDHFRAAHLAGDDDGEVAHHGRTCAECRSAVPTLTAARDLLTDPAIWEEAPGGLGRKVEALIGDGRREETSRRMAGWWGIAAAAAIAVVVAVAAVLRVPQPDWTVDIPGTALAPNAAATVSGWNTDDGTRMRLDASSLDSAPSGHVYELWLSEGPIHISAGTFRGGEDVELWAGVRREDYPRLWITLEPVDTDPSPSSQTVLDTG